MPTTRAPLIFAIWAATEPTAPAAAETTTVSPGCGLPMSVSPTQAVRPVMPSAPSAKLGDVSPRSGTGSNGAASEATTHSCQPVRPWTSWPSA